MAVTKDTIRTIDAYDDRNPVDFLRLSDNPDTLAADGLWNSRLRRPGQRRQGRGGRRDRQRHLAGERVRRRPRPRRRAGSGEPEPGLPQRHEIVMQKANGSTFTGTCERGRVLRCRPAARPSWSAPGTSTTIGRASTLATDYASPLDRQRPRHARRVHRRRQQRRDRHHRHAVRHDLRGGSGRRRSPSTRRSGTPRPAPAPARRPDIVDAVNAAVTDGWTCSTCRWAALGVARDDPLELALLSAASAGHLRGRVGGQRGPRRLHPRPPVAVGDDRRRQHRASRTRAQSCSATAGSTPGRARP